MKSTLQSVIKKHVVVAVIVISINTCRVWDMYFFMNTVKLVLDAPVVKKLTGAILFYGVASI